MASGSGDRLLSPRRRLRRRRHGRRPEWLAYRRRPQSRPSRRLRRPNALNRDGRMTTPQTHTENGRPRARGLSIVLPREPGLLNAITDVDGIEVGVTTLIDGASVRTGVTAILPRGRDGV